MVQEAYCSYEVAKLLKEKGFDEVCFKYALNGKIYNNGDFVICHRDDVEVGIPTLQMAMKWLREVHDIIVVVEPHAYDYINSKISSYVFCLWCGDNYEELYSNQHSNVYGVYYNSYEEAVEAALLYCLTNLI